MSLSVLSLRAAGRLRACHLIQKIEISEARRVARAAAAEQEQRRTMKRGAKGKVGSPDEMAALGLWLPRA